MTRLNIEIKGQKVKAPQRNRSRAFLKI